MKSSSGFIVLTVGAMMAVAPVALGQSSAPSQSDITNALRPVPSALAGGHQGLPSPGTAPLTQPSKPVYSTSYGGAPSPVAKERSHQTAAIPAGPAPDLAGCTASAAALPAASLPSITFEFGSAQLKPEAMVTLQNLGKSLKNDFPDTNTFLIEGHTDAAGTFAYNQELSRQRAEAVKDYLTQQMGIKVDQLSTAGVGYCDLANPADPKGAENRRVVVVNKAS